MAFTVKLITDFGEERELYVRLNNFDQLANHGVPAIARFRGYVSKEAFEAGARFVWEKTLEIEADAPDAPWKLAYAALKAYDPATPVKQTIAQIEHVLKDGQRELSELPADDKTEAAQMQREVLQKRIATAQDLLFRHQTELATAEKLRRALSKATKA